MTTYHRILTIINPVAGQHRTGKIHGIINDYLKTLGVEYEIRETVEQGDALRWSRTARAEGFDLVAVAGGDGSLREVVEGLMRSGGQLPMAHIPTGTTNVVARSLGIPTLDVRKAVALISKGKARSFDVGYLPEKDRYFVFVAGAGYDARLIHDTSPEMKKKIGFAAYVGTGIKHAFTTRPVKVKLEVDNVVRHMKAHTVMAVNIGSIAALKWAIAPGIDHHDGKLNIVIMSSRSWLGNLIVAFKIFTKRYHGFAALEHLTAERIRVTADPPLPFQIDGEALGTTPFLAEVIPRALQVIVPIDYPD